ncbi:hypothetical protein DFP72DRAFT_848710 [Ephemerocybe angulata]|uniref:Uncharacterized protein n=1 Tax=Ephemerocybe angulata TaxID=980116 RepID=A0A8H6HX60_9AGAR|nr:hypothetical protein DFP72DRAFT_848710 [Tulosesus angulatus]
MEDREAASILHHFETADLFVIGKLNSRLRSWLDWYCRSAWNMPKFAALYVKHPLALLSMMDEKNGVDLWRGRFQSRLSTGHMHHSRPVLSTPALPPDPRLRLGHAIPEGLPYKTGVDASVHERAGRHVLAASLYRVLIETTPTATLTCFMSGDRCVAPFANSAFRRKLAFTLRNRRLFTKDLHETTQVIEGDGRRLRFDIAAGPPLAYRAYQDAEIGSRFWGDNSCWVISRLREDLTYLKTLWAPKSAYKGPSFEVLDWRMLHDEEGTYLVIVQDIPMRCEYPPWSMLESGIKHASEGTHSRISDEYFRPSPLLISGQCLPRGLIRELEERRYKEAAMNYLGYTIYWQSVPKFVEHPPGHALLPGAVKASA